MSNSSCIGSALQRSTRVLHRHQVQAAVKLLVRTRRHPLTWRSPLLSIVSCLLGHLFMSLLVHHVLLLQELLLLHVLLQCQVIKARFWTSHAFLSMLLLLLMMLWPRLLVWMLLLRMLLLLCHLLLLLLPLYHQLLLHDHLLLHHLLLLLLLLLLLDQLLSVCLLHCYVVDLGSWHPA